ncbi:uncharacterized protein KY384_005046 [Bacidia gigantensis]|uniref:uncharacterized protein n=1 Tax=Bacidia gigantensis TaxID=2732470 RepID=UPI001D03F993|nr:uncharacterized protein KY384_005046 [Bacidia gigantensis]KAG8530543.1 hypothetical protein KY384_005046 [Bacidia gigantensis]
MRGVIILNPDDGDSHSHSNGILNNGEAVNSEVAEDAEYLTSNGRQAEPEELRRKTDILAKTQNFSRSNYGNLEDKDAIVASSSASSSATGSSRGPKHSKSYLLTLANAKNATGLPASPAANVDLPISTFVISSKAQVVGQVLSWASTALYLGSRLPQILKNSNRRSTAGVSLYMFVATFCGNFFYSAAIIANPLAWDSYGPYGCHGWAGPEGSDQSTWVKLTLPFWLGAAGVLVLDAYVIFQFIAYREKTEKVEMLVEDSRGRTTWKAVSGWMRGWVPSPGRRPTNDGDEDEWHNMREPNDQVDMSHFAAPNQQTPTSEVLELPVSRPSNRMSQIPTRQRPAANFLATEQRPTVLEVLLGRYVLGVAAFLQTSLFLLAVSASPLNTLPSLRSLGGRSLSILNNINDTELTANVACGTVPPGSTPIDSSIGVRLVGYWAPEQSTLCLDIYDLHHGMYKLGSFLSTSFNDPTYHYKKYLDPLHSPHYDCWLTFFFSNTQDINTGFEIDIYGTINDVSSQRYHVHIDRKGRPFIGTDQIGANSTDLTPPQNNTNQGVGLIILHSTISTFTYGQEFVNNVHLPGYVFQLRMWFAQAADVGSVFRVRVSWSVQGVPRSLEWVIKKDSGFVASLGGTNLTALGVETLK